MPAIPSPPPSFPFQICVLPVPQSGPVPLPQPFPQPSPGCNSTVEKVMIKMKDVKVEGSNMPSSSGDAAGTARGVVSGRNMGAVKPKMFSSNVLAEGKKVTFLGSISSPAPEQQALVLVHH